MQQQRYWLSVINRLILSFLTKKRKNKKEEKNDQTETQTIALALQVQKAKIAYDKWWLTQEKKYAQTRYPSASGQILSLGWMAVFGALLLKDNLRLFDFTSFRTPAQFKLDRLPEEFQNC